MLRIPADSTNLDMDWGEMFSIRLRLKDWTKSAVGNDIGRVSTGDYFSVVKN
jgi:hypothetical protein